VIDAVLTRSRAVAAPLCAVALLFLIQAAGVPVAHAAKSSDPQPVVATRLLAAAVLGDLPPDAATLRVIGVTLPAGQTIRLVAEAGDLLLLVERGNLVVLPASSPPLVIAPGEQWSGPGTPSIELRNEGTVAATILVVSLTHASP
jgi:hypothetical protein